MSIEILNNEECINYSDKYDDESNCSDLINTSTKIHSLYTSSFAGIPKIWNMPAAGVEYCRTWIGHTLRDTYFFALKVLSEREAIALEGEIQYFYNFWDPKAALDPNLPAQERIRNFFTMKDEILDIHVNGQRLAVTCRILETKNQSPHQKPYNFVFVPGNLTTIHNNIVGMYPFLASYLQLQDQQGNLPPARFIMTTQYDIRVVEPDGSKSPYAPASLDHVGTVLASILDQMNHTYGEIDQLMAHSLGTIVFSSALKHLKKSVIPKNLLIHCGPTSITEASKKLPLSKGGSFMGKIASWAGWSIDLADEIETFCKTYPEIDITISGMLEDHYFSGAANLCLSPKMRKLKEEGFLKDVLTFCPPFQMFDLKAQHNLAFCFLVPNYLIDPSSSHFLGAEDRDFSVSIIRRSLPKNENIESATG